LKSNRANDVPDPIRNIVVFD